MLRIQKLYSPDQPLPSLGEGEARVTVFVDGYAYSIWWSAEWDWLFSDPTHLMAGAMNICFATNACRLAKGEKKTISRTEEKELLGLLKDSLPRTAQARRRGFG